MADIRSPNLQLKYLHRSRGIQKNSRTFEIYKYLKREGFEIPFMICTFRKKEQYPFNSDSAVQVPSICWRTQTPSKTISALTGSGERLYDHAFFISYQLNLLLSG
jgi:hypothetical protein